MCDSFETNFYDKPYVFCDENLSDYEKTIYILALAYADDPICRLTEKNISELSSFLKVDVQLLTKALQKFLLLAQVWKLIQVLPLRCLKLCMMQASISV